MKVGVPRALHYYRYYPVIKTFFEALDVELLVSPPTTRSMMTAGISTIVAESCLPLKAYIGHVMDLIGKVDYVLVPSVKSLEPDLYNCVKLFALPDQVRGAIENAPPVLDALFDVNLGRKAVYKELYSLGRRVGASRSKVDRAAQLAFSQYQRFSELLRKGLTLIEAMDVLDGRCSEKEIEVSQLSPDVPAIALIGHPYNLYDDYINHNIVKKLRGMGLRILTVDAATTEQLNAGVARVIGSPYWMNEIELTGAAGHYMYDADTDGVMIITCFGCGPDSMMIDAVQRVAKRGSCNPILTVTIDEHTAETGLVTRLEAFVDTLHRRKSGTKALFEVPAAVSSGNQKFPKDMRRKMKIAFPHMGTVHVAIRVLFNKLGIDYVAPPGCNKLSLDRAAKHSPEWACVPYKLTLGNFLDGLELGANAVMLLTGPNNCRFGYYHKLQEQVLRDLGYEFQFVLPEISGRTLSRVSEILQEASGRSGRECMDAAMLALSVQKHLDALERKVQRVRARELKLGTANELWKAAIEQMIGVADRASLKMVRREFDEELDAVAQDLERDPVKICIVGEVYVVQEPFINQDIETELGRLGAEAHRSEQVSQWLSVFPGVILDWLGLGHQSRIRRSERPYLKYWSGETVGQAVMAYEDGYDGVIQLAPFTCTPEVVAQNVMPKLRKNVDIPLLTFILDEQTGRAGMVTRLEAFVDLLQRRRTSMGPRKPKLTRNKLLHVHWGQ
ncbi:MAG: acyl-CoA dehydratase activase-related protein [Chloroflexi bacterium]|nr:acyl-CoA dehydratase activase-related protein [Chloroflexota bacterium]